MTAGTTKETFVSAFRALEAGGNLGGPPWLRDLRRKAIARFAERGLPTPRDEEWKYTSIAPIAAVQFDLEAAGGAEGADDGLAEEAIAPFCVSPAWSRLVLVDGRYSAKLSAIRPLSRARIESLAEALIIDAEMLRPHLIRSAPAEATDAFAALNAAFWRDGALIHLPAGARVA